jgi:hypothetical protein
MFPDTDPKPKSMPLPPQPGFAPQSLPATPPVNEQPKSVLPFGETAPMHPSTLVVHRPVPANHGPTPPDPTSIRDGNCVRVFANEDCVVPAKSATVNAELAAPPTEDEPPVPLETRPAMPPAAVTVAPAKPVAPAAPPVARRVATHLSQSLSH